MGNSSEKPKEDKKPNAPPQPAGAGMGAQEEDPNEIARDQLVAASLEVVNEVRRLDDGGKKK